MANRTCKGSGSAVTSPVGSRLCVASVRFPCSRCFVESVPVYFGPAYHFQIVQNPQTIVMLVERMHLHRIIQIGAEHSADVLNGERLSYLGYSVAHWEGAHLVV